MSELILVFDLDDTLYPERQFALSGFAAAGRWAEAELGVTGLAVDMARLLDEGYLGELFRIALAGKLPHHTPEQLTGLIGAYRDHDPELSLFDDAAWALHRFANAKLGLITDGTHRMQERKVTALGIAARFREIVYTHALGGRQYSKPHPRSYEMIEAALGGRGDRLVYIGDNPAKDFIVPNERGWISIMVERPEFPRIHARAKVAPGGAPQHTVASLTELPALLGL
ncbi:MAG TPA: HAD family hydrolase [Hyphomicrobiaceae bacterium]|nr:HAD family hydrolase [Hyphomicrobiaceae bacterium]